MPRVSRFLCAAAVCFSLLAPGAAVASLVELQLSQLVTPPPPPAFCIQLDTTISCTIAPGQTIRDELTAEVVPPELVSLTAVGVPPNAIFNAAAAVGTVSSAFVFTPAAAQAGQAFAIDFHAMAGELFVTLRLNVSVLVPATPTRTATRTRTPTRTPSRTPSRTASATSTATATVTATAPPQALLRCGPEALKQYRDGGTDCVYRRGTRNAFTVVFAHTADGTNPQLAVTDPKQPAGRTKTKVVTKSVAPTRTVFKVQVPDDNPVGIYQLRGGILVGESVVASPPLRVFVIFDVPPSLRADAAAIDAYLYDEHGTRDENSYHFNARSKWLRKGGARWQAEWPERTYALTPFDKNLFAKLIEAVDGETAENTVAEKLMKTTTNAIIYDGSPDGRYNVRDLLGGVSAKAMRDAYAGTEAQLVKGQCLDYANALAAMLRAVGIPARVATKLDDPDFAYHQWTEAYLEKPDAGTDHWFLYDAMDYTPVPHTAAADAIYEPVGKGTRAGGTTGGPALDYTESAFEILVGGTDWVADGKVRVAFTNPPTDDRVGVRRLSNATDALFEKCEKKHYAATNCPDIDPVGDDPIVQLSMAQPDFRVGDVAVVTVELINAAPAERAFDLAVRFLRRHEADDGRDAFGDSVLGIPGTGVLGTTLLERTARVIVPAGETAERVYELPLLDAFVPRDAYAVEATATVEDVSETEILDFVVRPAFDLTVTLPPDAAPDDALDIGVVVANRDAVALANLTVALEAPEFYETSDPLSREFPSVAPDDSAAFGWTLMPIRPDVPSLQHLRITATSDNGGSEEVPLAVRLQRPPLLALRAVESPMEAALGEGFGLVYEIENIGDAPVSGVAVTLDLPAEMSAAAPVDRDVGSLEPGAAAVVDWWVTGTAPGTHLFAIAAEDASGEHAAARDDMVEIAVPTPTPTVTPSPSAAPSAPASAPATAGATHTPTVRSPTATGSASATPATASPTATAAAVRGDADCDGALDGADVPAAVAAAFDPSHLTRCPQADANTDNRSSAADIVIIIRLLGGLGGARRGRT